MIAKNWSWKSPSGKIANFFRRKSILLNSLSDESEPRIGVLSDSCQSPVAFEAVGLPLSELERLASHAPHDSAFGEIFAVYPDTIGSDADSNDAPPVSGSYVVDGARLTFIPGCQLQPGNIYRVVLRAGDPIFFNGKAHEPTTIEREVTIPALTEL